MSNPELFEASFEYPDPAAGRRLEQLIGIDEYKVRLEKGLRLLLDKSAIDRWSNKHHGVVLPLVSYFRARPPLFVLAGDVGTGKTALAESIGNSVALAEGVSVTLHRLSLASRGSGLVGEMTNLISAAFQQVAEYGRKAKNSDGSARAAHILLIDEADALAQSRETTQMHHEDRAGVNALIRGINELSEDNLPVAVIMCTNRMTAVDPAIQRRAAEILTFGRPTADMRKHVLSEGLAGTDINESQIDELVAATGARSELPSFTFSDITQRLLPNLALDAYPDTGITFDRALSIAKSMNASPAFGENAID